MSRLNSQQQLLEVLMNSDQAKQQEIGRLQQEKRRQEQEIALLMYNSEQDSYAYSIGFLNDVVCNVFLCIQKGRLAPPRIHSHFHNLWSNNNVAFRKLSDELKIPDSYKERFSIDADNAVDERNRTVHYESSQHLKSAVSKAAELFVRHPTLVQNFSFHHFVVTNFHVFERVYPKIFNLSTTHQLVRWQWDQHLIGAIAKLALSLLWPDSPSISDYPSNKNGMTP